MFTSALMMVAPPAATDFDATHVNDIEVTSANEAAEVLVHDDAGEVSATLVFWIDSHGRVRLDTDFADGLYLSAVIDGQGTTIATNDRAEVARRLTMIIDNTNLRADSPDGGTTAASIAGCGWGVVATAGACAAAQAIFCVGGAIVAACECLPLIVDEWEEYSCPYFG